MIGTNYKRVIIYILVVAVAVSSVTMTVSAAEAVPVKYPVYNLMDNTYFKLYADGQQIGDTHFDTSYYFEGVSSLRWEWLTDYNSNVSHIYVIVNAGPVAPTVYLSPFPNDPYIYGPAELMGEVAPGYYMYKEWAFNNGNTFNVTVEYSSPYTGSCNIVSACGIVQVSEEVDSCKFTMQNCIISFDGMQYQMVTASDRSIPFYQSSVQSVDDETKFWNHSRAYIRLNSDDFVTKMAESATVMVSFVPGLLESDVQPYGCNLIDSTGAPVAVVPVTAERSHGYSTHIYGDFEYKAECYLVTADLSGYDLEDLGIEFVFTFDNLDYGEFGGIQKIARFECLGCYIMPFVEENNSFFGKTLYFLTNIWTSIKNGFSAIGDFFGTLFDKLDAFFSGGAAGEALSNAGASMSDQAQSMNEANSQLDSIDRPSIDPSSLFGDFLNFDTGGLRVLSVITSNKYVTPLMVVVFTFALCGYVFFGKKG